MAGVPRLDGGWLVVPYTGPEHAQLHIAVGTHKPGEWRPAYLDRPAGVAKVRPPGMPGRYVVWLRVNGVVTAVGTI